MGTELFHADEQKNINRRRATSKRTVAFSSSANVVRKNLEKAFLGRSVKN